MIHLPSLIEGKPCFLPPLPTFFTLNALDYDFNINAPMPVQWLAFLQKLWPGDSESIGTQQEWFGLCLLPETTFQKMLLLIGPPRSGKGTIARVLNAVVGKGNVCGPPITSLGGEFGLAPLLDKTLAIIPDARVSSRTDAGMVIERLLAITGEDTLTVNRKHRSPITVQLRTRLMLLSNELPKLADSSRALISRAILLQLTKSWKGAEDKTLTMRLLTELPSILLWAIAGWQRLHQQGYFTQPKSGEELLRELEDLSSPIGAFVNECCVLDATQSVPIKDLFTRWRNWCQAKGDVFTGNEQ